MLVGIQPPKTAEEFVVKELLETKAKVEELTITNITLKKSLDIKSAILKVIRKYITLENGSVWVHINEICETEDFRFIVDEFMLEEEAKNDE